VPNRIVVEDEQTKTPFDTIMPYIYVVGKDKSSISNLGVEQ
jgi:ribosomal protein S4E